MHVRHLLGEDCFYFPVVCMTILGFWVSFMISNKWLALATVFPPVIWCVSFLGFIGICAMKRRTGFAFKEKIKWINKFKVCVSVYLSSIYYLSLFLCLVLSVTGGLWAAAHLPAAKASALIRFLRNKGAFFHLPLFDLFFNCFITQLERGFYLLDSFEAPKQVLKTFTE